MWYITFCHYLVRDIYLVYTIRIIKKQTRIESRKNKERPICIHIVASVVIEKLIYVWLDSILLSETSMIKQALVCVINESVDFVISSHSCILFDHFFVCSGWSEPFHYR